MSLRDRIKGLTRQATEPFFVPEWAATVLLKRFTVAELFDAKKAIRARAPKDGEVEDIDLVVGMVVAGTLEADGSQAFTADDVEMLKAQDGLAVSELFAALDRINGITEAAAERLRKNYVPTPTASGSSGSPTGAGSPSSSTSTTPTPPS